MDQATADGAKPAIVITRVSTGETISLFGDGGPLLDSALDVVRKWLRPVRSEVLRGSLSVSYRIDEVEFTEPQRQSPHRR